jgi:hypothetical protein
MFKLPCGIVAEDGMKVCRCFWAKKSTKVERTRLTGHSNSVAVIFDKVFRVCFDDSALRILDLILKKKPGNAVPPLKRSVHFSHPLYCEDRESA